MKRIGLLSDTHSFWDPKYLEYFEECEKYQSFVIQKNILDERF